MFSALALIVLSQFVTPGCKPNQSCTLANLTVTNTGSISTATITGNASNGSVVMQNNGGTVFVGAGTNTATLFAGTSSINVNGLPNDIAIAGTVSTTLASPTTTIKNFVSSDGGIFLGGQLQLNPQSLLTTCDAQRNGLIQTVNIGTGTNLFFCDGVQTGWVRIPVIGSSSSGTPGLANITSRTIASGIITTGNALLGSGELNFASSSTGTVGTLKISDAIRTQCATAGTGAGNMLVNFRKLTGGATTICTVNYPCASAALTPVTASCTATITGVIGSFATDAWGTTLDVSGCTTAPADCTVNHSITSG